MHDRCSVSAGFFKKLGLKSQANTFHLDAWPLSTLSPKSSLNFHSFFFYIHTCLNYPPTSTQTYFLSSMGNWGDGVHSSLWLFFFFWHKQQTVVQTDSLPQPSICLEAWIPTILLVFDRWVVTNTVAISNSWAPNFSKLYWWRKLQMLWEQGFQEVRQTLNKRNPRNKYNWGFT